MLGTRTIISKLALSLTFATLSFAAGQEYFPLEAGNSWVYRVTQGRTSRSGTIDVLGREALEGREYFRVRFFENNLLLRYAENGSLFVYDPEAKQDKMWAPFGAAEGEEVQTAMDACSRTAVVESTNAPLRTLMGDFTGTLKLTYRPNCADAGVTMQYFLPYVGMVLHETTSIAGPVRHELVYSRTGLTSVDARTNAFTVALDAQSYKTGETALARLTLRLSQPVMLTFPSAQNADLRIYDEKGQIVYAWSADKLFALVFREERFGPGERSFALDAPLANLAPGRYTAEAWLTTQPRMYSGVVSFEIVR